MSQFYAYICTNTTADPYVPTRAINLDTLARDVSDGFAAISGGRLEVGRIALYPVQRSVANHLLCDGREVSKTSFPELYGYLGDTQGTAGDPANFKLPDYLTDFAPAPTADVETVIDGTVSTPEPTVPPPTYYSGVQKLYGNVDSGGRRGEIPVEP